MTKRFTDSDIWSKDWFLDLSLKRKLLIKFLFDNCDCAGIYEISYRTLKNCFNEEITKKDFEGLKQIKFIDDNTIFIEDFIKYQYKCDISGLNPKFSVHKGIIRKLNKYGIFETLTKGLHNPYNVNLTMEGLQDKDKDKDKDNINLYNNESEKKIDPFTNPINEYYIQEYKKFMGNKPYLTQPQIMKLYELTVTDKNIKETITKTLENFANINFEDINFKPSSAWLLQGDNFAKVFMGEFTSKPNFKTKEQQEIEAYEKLQARLDKWVEEDTECD